MFITDLADKLRAYTAPNGKRLNVIEVQGWKYRGYQAANGWQMDAVKGVLWHHTATASARYWSEGAPTLNMCINGRSDLPGPLAHIVFGRNAEVYVIAAGWANHAGEGEAPGIPVNRGNEFLIGVEMESSGVAPADWTAAQLEYMPILAAALERGYGGGNPNFLQVAHKEYAGPAQGKIDPSFIDMDAFRDNINKLLAGQAPAGTGDWFDMATKKELEEVLFYTPRPEWGNRTLVDMVKIQDSMQWSTLRMVKTLFNQFRIGIPGRMRDGSVAGKLRELLGYNEATQGNARKEEFDNDTRASFMNFPN